MLSSSISFFTPTTSPGILLKAISFNFSCEYLVFDFTKAKAVPAPIPASTIDPVNVSIANFLIFPFFSFIISLLFSNPSFL